MFIDDKEKMFDFIRISKDEFLATYSYLDEDEYDYTVRTVYLLYRDEVKIEFNEDDDVWELIKKDSGVVVDLGRSVVELVNNNRCLR